MRGWGCDDGQAGSGHGQAPSNRHQSRGGHPWGLSGSAPPAAGGRQGKEKVRLSAHKEKKSETQRTSPNLNKTLVGDVSSLCTTSTAANKWQVQR